MNVLKSLSKPGDSPKPNSGRRSFIWKTGAAMSAVVASSVAGFAKSGADRSTGLQDQIDRLSSQLGSLEDANAIRRMHQAYESHLDQGMYEEVTGMFADDSEVVYNSGLFKGKDGIRRLYCDHFSAGRTGRKIGPAPGFETDPAQQLDIVEVAGDRKTATGRFPYSMQVGAPMTGDSSFVQMARLQGQGIVKWWEGGIYEISYVKESEAWKIKRLDFRTTAQADHAPGRAYANPISVPRFSKAYPEHPTGPDKLV